MRAELPKDKSISIAAPASYWYLRNFPIKQMAKTIDYIVYMTYDLHGQWDAGSQWSTDGENLIFVLLCALLTSQDAQLETACAAMVRRPHNARVQD